jgi:hypothetical protein
LCLQSSSRNWRNIFSYFIVASLALVAAPEVARTESRNDQLQLCLQDFDGIEMKLPYRPLLRVRSCATPEVGYDTSKTSDGHRRLELIGDLTLGTEAKQLPPDEQYAALQQATLVHFDALFKQRGYHLVSTEQGNARTEGSAYTQCLLRAIVGTNCTPDQPQMPKTPIPYVSLARYERQQDAQTIVITYKTEVANTWSISLDGVPENSGTQ